MSVPNFQALMLPLLRSIQDGQSRSMREVIPLLADEFKLTPEDRAERLPSGKQLMLDNRVGWARTYLKKAGLLTDPRRGEIAITEAGKQVLAKNPEKIDIKFLNQFPGFTEFRETVAPQESQTETTITTQTPDELLEQGYNQARRAVGEELLSRLRETDPAFFEQIVLKLLTAMGYGEGRVTGRSGDGGVDGFVSQDRLGLDRIFFQAKRFGENNPVSASMVRDFVGTLHINGVDKGVFITTSYFPKSAEQTQTGKNTVLIDGQKLVELMYEYNVGVTPDKVYSVKKVDGDFFTE